MAESIGSHEVKYFIPPRSQVSNTSTSIHLQWNSSAPCNTGSYGEYYVLEISGWYSFVGPENEFSIIYEGPAKDFNVESLQPAKRYKFRLTAINYQGISRPSTVIFLTTKGEAPSAPSAPSVVEDAASAVHLLWDKRPGDEEFTLQMDDGKGFLPIYNGQNNQHTVTGLKCNKRYKFRLRSYNEIGTSQ